MKGRQEGEKRRKEESKGGREMNGETGARKSEIRMGIEREIRKRMSEKKLLEEER